MNTAEVMAVAIVGALFFGGNFSRARLMLKNHRYMSNMLSESRLNRRMHEIDISAWQRIFQIMARTFQEQDQNLEYLWLRRYPCYLNHFLQPYQGCRGQVGFEYQ